MVIKRLYIIILFVLCYLFASEAKVHNNMPLVWDMSGLEQMRVDKRANMVTKRIMKTADGLCEKQPVAVTDKKKLLLNLISIISAASYLIGGQIR